MYLKTGRIVTYYHGIEGLVKSFKAVGIRDEVLSDNVGYPRYNR